MSDPAEVITCIDCGGRAHLLTKPDDFGWEEGQTLFYRVCDDRAASILSLLHEMFCAGPGAAGLRESRMARSAPSPDKAARGD